MRDPPSGLLAQDAQDAPGAQGAQGSQDAPGGQDAPGSQDARGAHDARGTHNAAGAGGAGEAGQLRARLNLLERELAAAREACLAQQSLSDQLQQSQRELDLALTDARVLREAAQQAATRQVEFLAMLAHELRNPLAPISLANAMIARLPEPPIGLLNLHTIIHRQVLHLTRLLDDLLDAARISSGKITLLRSPMSLVELLRRAVQTVQVRLLDRHQRVDLALPEELVINGDPVRLAQVFANLLVNASKYTGDGGVIRLAAHALDGKAVVTVADNGAGMAPEVMLHIFALFTQGPRALARVEGGLGVGLSVVRNIVQLHGGEVAAASDGLGCGSVFTVSLPLCDGVAQVADPVPGIARAVQRRILLVEDNVDANEMLGDLLRAEGHTVTSAYDGIAGLRLAQNRDFDVLVCDIGLPGMDGLELITELRGAPGAHIPFAIAISGYGQTRDRTRAIAAGYGQYFVKPIDAGALLALIASDTVSRFIGHAASKR